MYGKCQMVIQTFIENLKYLWLIVFELGTEKKIKSIFKKLLRTYLLFGRS